MFFIANRQLSIFILLFSFSLIGCNKTKDVPLVTTRSVTEIDGRNATGGGEVLNDGGSAVISRGLCWNHGTQPSLLNYQTMDGTGTGSFTSKLTDLNGNMIYYVRAYATNLTGTGYGEVISFTSFGQMPEASAISATQVKETTATLNGKVNTNNLPTTVTFEYGTTTEYKSSVSSAEGILEGGKSEVSAVISGLKSASFYHFRIKAVNSLGIAYGNDIKFSTILTDIEGNNYNVVNIGSQIWMQENLKTSRYNNGNLIVTTFSPALDISNEVNPKYQWDSNIAGYGRFYTYYAATDDRGVCPTGWHVPTDAEWTDFTDFVSNNGYGWKGNAANIAKSLAATSGWVNDTVAANIGNDQGKNNSTGFNGFGTGGRYSNGVIGFPRLHGIWATSTESSETSSFFRCIGYIPAEVFRGVFKKSYGLSFRCLKN